MTSESTHLLAQPLADPKASRAETALQPFSPLPYALLRTPIASYRYFVDSAPGGDPRQQVLAFFQKELAWRALRTKSHALWSSLQRKLAAGQALEADAYTALYRYMARITTRSTPLQLLAGISTVTVGDFAGLRMSPPSGWHVRIMPSWVSVQAFTRSLLQDPAVRERSLFRFNETAQARGGILYYFTDQLPDGFRTAAPRYRVVSLRLDAPLRALLAPAHHGRIFTWNELSQRLLAAVPAATSEAIATYLVSLLDSGFLIDNLRSPSVGIRPEQHLHRLATEGGALLPFAADSHALQDLTQRALPVDDPAFDKTWDAVERHPWFVGDVGQPAGSSSQLRAGTPSQAVLQIGVEEGGLPQAPLTQLADCVGRTPFLWMPPPSPYRRLISELFSNGTMGRRIPFLDVVYHIAHGGTVEEMSLPPQDLAERRSPPHPQRLVDEVLSRALFDADLQACESVQLPIAELAAVMQRQGVVMPSPPIAYESLVRWVQHAKRTHLLVAGTTSRIGQSTTRFQHWDPHDRILQQQQELWRRQEAELAPAILAEVTSGGSGRLRDLSQRPLTYRYQIVAGGPPSVPTEFQIPLSELSVTMGADGPMLLWERRGVPVVARQLSALIPPAHSAVVSILLSLDPHGMDWGLGVGGTALPIRTARICYGDVILHPQSWTLLPSMVRMLRMPRRERDDDALRDLIRAWRARYGVPRIVRLGDAEHNAVDLDGPMAIVELAGMVEDRLVRVHEEFLDEGSIAQGHDGPLIVEALVQFQRPQRTPQAEAPPAAPSPPAPTGPAPEASASTFAPPTQASRDPAAPDGLVETRELRRAHLFPPGSAWLYLKFYYGAGLAQDDKTRTFLDEDLLGRFFAPLVADCEKQGLLADFHFVRYADPEPHLRLRLRSRGMSPLQLLEQLRTRFDRELHDDAYTRWEVSTYAREVDRYGGPALIEAAEQLFTADSRLCLRILSAAQRDLIDPDRDLGLYLPVRLIHTLYRGFGLDLAQRQALFLALRKQHERNVQARTTQERDLKAALDAQYRSHAAVLHDLVRFVEGQIVQCDLACMLRRDLTAAFSAYEQTLRSVAATYHAAATLGQLRRSIPDVLASLFHMHCNRLLGSNPREYAVLCMAQRAAEAVLARQRSAARRPDQS